MTLPRCPSGTRPVAPGNIRRSLASMWWSSPSTTVRSLVRRLVTWSFIGREDCTSVQTAADLQAQADVGPVDLGLEDAALQVRNHRSRVRIHRLLGAALERDPLLAKEPADLEPADGDAEVLLVSLVVPVLALDPDEHHVSRTKPCSRRLASACDWPSSMLLASPCATGPAHQKYR